MAVEKKAWVVRADFIKEEGDPDHFLHEEFTTREKAREYKRLLKELGGWENVRMYQIRELLFKDGSISLAMWPAR